MREILQEIVQLFGEWTGNYLAVGYTHRALPPTFRFNNYRKCQSKIGGSKTDIMNLKPVRSGQNSRPATHCVESPRRQLYSFSLYFLFLRHDFL